MVGMVWTDKQQEKRKLTSDQVKWCNEKTNKAQRQTVREKLMQTVHCTGRTCSAPIKQHAILIWSRFTHVSIPPLAWFVLAQLGERPTILDSHSDKVFKGFYWPKRDEKMYKKVPIFRCTTPSTGKRLVEFEVVVGTLSVIRSCWVIVKQTQTPASFFLFC